MQGDISQMSVPDNSSRYGIVRAFAVVICSYVSKAENKDKTQRIFGCSLF